MYFPYFRGRQVELLALRDLVKDKLIGKYIFPVIEPVKLTATFNSTFQAFADMRSSIALIFNPRIGEYKESDGFVDVYYSRENVITDIVPALLMNNNTQRVVQLLEARNVKQSDIIAIIDNRDSLLIYKDAFPSITPKFTLFRDERQLRRSIASGRVLFEDKFHKQGKNADYAKNEDEFFSEDHLYFKDEGYVGFGDYSIVGDEYNESGFAPYAVVIHVVYFADDRTLRVRHFVSDSNKGIDDVAGKFYEAVRKLAKWYKEWYQYSQQNQMTIALSMLLSHYENGTYPGLPSIKKLSIMHHLELLSKYLEKGIE